MIMHKPFEPDLYAETDAIAKQAVREYLDNLGHLTCCHEDFGADIKSLKPMLHEVEIKKVWRGEWPAAWKTVDIPARKARLLNGSEIVFWVLDNDRRYAWLVRGSLLKDEYLNEKPNKVIDNGEFFYRVPCELCHMIKLRGE